MENELVTAKVKCSFSSRNNKHKDLHTNPVNRDFGAPLHCYSGPFLISLKPVGLESAGYHFQATAAPEKSNNGLDQSTQTGGLEDRSVYLYCIPSRNKTCHCSVGSGGLTAMLKNVIQKLNILFPSFDYENSCKDNLISQPNYFHSRLPVIY